MNKLKKAETVSKIIGAVSIPLIGLAVTILLHFDSKSDREQQFIIAEENRKAQLLADIMSRRESADSEIRASMFNTLMTKYLGGFSLGDQEKVNIDDLRRKVVFLNLLIGNFQEYFNSKPLFEDLYRQINELEQRELGKWEAQKLKQLRKELIKISRSTAKKQEVMLSRIGMTKSLQLKKGRTKCILLYNPYSAGLKEKSRTGQLKDMDVEYEGKCRESQYASAAVEDEAGTQENAKKAKNHYAIEVTAADIKDSEVAVKITLYQDYFKGDVYDYRQLVRNDIDFDVSYFDLPYMDNTRLFNGSRFALILQEIPPSKNWVELGVITFHEEFMSLRDRPLFEQMLKKLQKG